MEAISKVTGSSRVEVVGVVQPSEEPSQFMPENVPSEGVFHWLDIPSMVRPTQALSHAMSQNVDTRNESECGQRPGSLGAHLFDHVVIAGLGSATCLQCLRKTMTLLVLDHRSNDDHTQLVDQVSEHDAVPLQPARGRSHYYWVVWYTSSAIRRESQSQQAIGCSQRMPCGTFAHNREAQVH